MGFVPPPPKEMAPDGRGATRDRPAYAESKGKRSFGSGDPVLLRSLINRCESGELHFPEDRPRCHCAIWQAPRALSGC
jgi:hypothetical protein